MDEEDDGVEQVDEALEDEDEDENEELDEDDDDEDGKSDRKN